MRPIVQPRFFGLDISATYGLAADEAMPPPKPVRKRPPKNMGIALAWVVRMAPTLGGLTSAFDSPGEPQDVHEQDIADEDG